MTRRKFLIGGATAAGALIVGYGLWPSRRLARARQNPVAHCGFQHHFRLADQPLRNGQKPLSRA
jgi:hypothetical protein